MDSITHVVLGAACGQAILGKKMGNRAMLWGSIGGSLPDFDVFGQLFLDPLNGMLFHRGPMHSLVFVLIIPFLLGPLIKKLYDGNWYKKKVWKMTGIVTGIILYLFSGMILCWIYSLLFDRIPWALIIILVAGGTYFFIKRYKQTVGSDIDTLNVSAKDWTLLFLCTTPIHPLLDSLTTYGTVLFWPFDTTRVAISNIAIADPMYTIPFAVFVMMAVLQPKENFRRNLLNYIGIGVSSFYLILTAFNKHHINHLFEGALKKNNIQYTEYITVPTILNNFLWYGIAKMDSSYVYSYYSLYDQENTFTELQFVKGHHELFDKYRDQETAKLLPWFSDGYYSLILNENNKIQYNDLRYGTMTSKMNSKEDFIFKFNLVDNQGKLQMPDDQRGPENKREDIEWFKKRIFGIK